MMAARDAVNMASKSKEAPMTIPSSAASLISPPPIPPSVIIETASKSVSPVKKPAEPRRHMEKMDGHGVRQIVSGSERRHQKRNASRAALRTLWCL